MTRRDTIIKWTAYGVILAVITVLDYYVLGRLAAVTPMLLPAAAVAAGTLENPKFGAGFGLACGLIMASLGHRSLLCIPVLAAAGWVAALVAQYLLRKDLVGCLICIAILLAAWECATLLWMGRRLDAPLGLLLRVVLPELLWSLVFAFPVYWAIRFGCVHYGRIYHE